MNRLSGKRHGSLAVRSSGLSMPPRVKAAWHHTAPRVVASLARLTALAERAGRSVLGEVRARSYRVYEGSEQWWACGSCHARIA